MKRHERWLYQDNSLSQQLMILYIIGNTAFTIFYTIKADVDYELGIFIMLNILISLIAFLAAVRQKAYTSSYGLTGIGLAVFQWLRILWIPSELIPPLRLWLQGILLVSGLFALSGSLICIKRSRERQNYILENEVDLAILQR